MAVSILTPFPVIADIDGTPLDDGYIWIGQDGLDPVANPQTVYWDAALTDVATQPVRTRGGFALDGTSRARLFAAGVYSIRVDNANGSTVYQSLSENGLYGGNVDAAAVNFVPAGTGAVTRSAQTKMREYVSAADFGAVGAALGATPPDETTALTNFFNSAIANPGVPHRMAKRVYGVTSALPTIDTSGVIITGSGHSTVHNVGPIFSTTTIQWLGGVNPGTMLTIEPDVNAVSGQQLSGIEISGIAFNCSSAIARGVTIRSVRSSLLMLGVANATNTGVTLGVLAPGDLAENESLQTNDIYLALRQVDGAGANGVPLRLQGSTAANVSLNRFRMVEIIHGNTSAVIEENADNNIWEEIRCFATGTATYSVEWLGADVEANSCRAEQFDKFTSNKPAVGRGTGAYPYPATNNLIFGLDRDNATPDPVFEVGATGVWQDTRGFFGGSSNVGVLGLGGVFADGITGLINGRARVGTESLHIVNNSTDHVRLSNNDGSIEWGLSIDGTGNLRTVRIAGSGNFNLPSTSAFNGGVITIGAPDSGGTGFRVLRVPN